MSEQWVAAGTVDAITKARKVVLEHAGRPVLVLAHEGNFYAFDNVCIHKQRELSKGMVFKGCIVCPGHQWAFDLTTGWEAVKQQTQPTFPVRVIDDVVEVELSSVAAAAEA